MRNINEFKVNDLMEWMGGSARNHLMSGSIIERVRAKTRPKYEGVATHGVATKKSVSFIVRHLGKIYWVSAEQVCLTKKKTTHPSRAVKSAKEISQEDLKLKKTESQKITHAPKKQENIKNTSHDMKLNETSQPTPIPQRGMPLPKIFKQDFSRLLQYLKT